MIQKSCPALLVLDDDDFRKKLIKSLDEQHFSVTFAPDGPEAIKLLESRPFRVVILGLNLSTGKGKNALNHLRENKKEDRAVIVVGEASAETRKEALWANETLLKPVDPAWIATRARAYCGH